MAEKEEEIRKDEAVHVRREKNGKIKGRQCGRE